MVITMLNILPISNFSVSLIYSTIFFYFDFAWQVLTSNMPLELQATFSQRVAFSRYVHINWLILPTQLGDH